jgi:hypothetical protein
MPPALDTFHSFRCMPQQFFVGKEARMGFDLVAFRRPEERAYLTGAAMTFLLCEMAAHDLLDTATPAPAGKAIKHDMRLLAQRSPSPFQVPKFKFWTNDGWVVTAEECYLLAYRLRQCPDPRVHLFAAFAASCVCYGGIAIHQEGWKP